MFDQRNQQFQTIILSSSVMFSALSTVIIQGILPDTSGDIIFVSYALTTSLSLAFLFIAIVMCIEIITRASKFMYQKARKQTDQLSDAIIKTRNMMTEIRREGREGSVNRRNKEDWVSHDDTIHKFLREREMIHYQAAGIVLKGNGNDNGIKEGEKEVINTNTNMNGNDRELDMSMISFEEYWETNCQNWGEMAISFFYAGSAFLLMAIMTFMWANFGILYNNLTSAILAVILIGLGLLIGFGYLLRSKYEVKHEVNETVLNDRV